MKEDYGKKRRKEGIKITRRRRRRKWRRRRRKEEEEIRGMIKR